MKKYTLIFILLLSMTALVACKDKGIAPKYEDGETINENIVQGEPSEDKEGSENSNEDLNSPNESQEKKPLSGEENPDTAKYYEMNILSVSNNGKSRELEKNESALVYNLVDIVDWNFTPEENFVSDYKILDNIDILFEFNSETKVLKDTKNDIYIKLHNELATVLLLALNGEL